MENIQPAFLKSPHLSVSTSSLRTQGYSRYDDSTTSAVEKYSLPSDPALFSLNSAEPDDDLHTPDPRRDLLNDSGTIMTIRALMNLGCIAVLLLGILTLFAGYPIITYFSKSKLSYNDGFNLGGLNASGLVPEMPGGRGLIDKDTPEEARTKISYVDGSTLKLVFSDEFNVEGRTFYPGDDPYWEAVDLHYWQTGNLEWYDPAAITTRNGSLEITLTETDTHDLKYQGGMMSSWNQFCFTGGLIEAAVRLPGRNDIEGLWPAVWTMGNLGRAGYGASLEGMWPYTYDTCDVGTVANQTFNGIPDVSQFPGDIHHDNHFSYLPGQKLSRCTCPGESHPGPVHSDGTYVGRSAPEIDIIEALVTGDPKHGAVSQSGQWAPYNAGYEWFNTSENLIIPDLEITNLNTYVGGVWQQSISSVTKTNQDCYEMSGTGCFAVFGFEYEPGYVEDNAHITWISDDKVVWTMDAGGTVADPRVNIGPRPVPQEPLYIIVNLGISGQFGFVDFENLIFPTTMAIDYIRVYQHPDNINYGCEPEKFPTQAYINEYPEAYHNAKLTTWIDDFKQPFPKNSFLGQC